MPHSYLGEDLNKILQHRESQENLGELPNEEPIEECKVQKIATQPINVDEEEQEAADDEEAEDDKGDEVDGDAEDDKGDDGDGDDDDDDDDGGLGANDQAMNLLCTSQQEVLSRLSD